MKRPSRFTLVFISVMLVYIFGYVLHTTANPKYPFEADMPNYAVALAQSENSELYTRDPIFRDGAFTKMLWSSGYTYMSLLRNLYNITQHNISATLALLQLIPAFGLFLSFYWLLCAFPLDRWLCMVFSVGISYWFILSRLEGIPSVYYYACVPVFLRLLWQFLSEPSLNKKPVVLWKVVLIGISIGASPMLINSVNGLAFNIMTLCLVTGQFLAKRMPWRAYAALLIGLVPVLCFAALSGAGGASAIQDDATALFLFNDLPTGTLGATIQSGLIWYGTLQIFNVHNSWLFYFPAVIGVALMSAWVAYARRPGRTLKIMYLTASFILWLWIVGNLGIILYLYFLSRFWRRRETAIDYVLITGISVGVFIGPALLWILVLVWKMIQWHSLVFIMWQMFRFHMLTYFFVGVALVFMIEHLTARVSNISTRRVIQLMFVLGLGIQSASPVFSISFLVMLMLALIFIRQSFSSRLYFTRPLISFNGSSIVKVGVLSVVAAVLVMAAAFWATWGSTWSSSVPLDLNSFMTVNNQIQSLEDNLRRDYMDMTEWLRVNTPQDSLIHLDYDFSDRNGYFRFLTQRAMFFTWMDQFVGQYSAALSASNRQILADLGRLSGFRFGALIALYDINYVVVHNDVSPFLPALDKGQWYVPALVYKNTSYDIYQVKKISTGELISMLLSQE